jgi:hypothetical protein
MEFAAYLRLPITSNLQHPLSKPQTIMATPNPKLTEELSSLTDEATEAVADLSSPSTPAHISAPQTPRWLSLASYESMPKQWKWESELEAEVEDALVFSDDDSEGQSASGEEHGVGESLEEWGPESVEIDPLERTTSRILAVLRCYLYNLEHGMLITGSKVDERIEAALKILLGKGQVGANCRTQKPQGPDMRESWEISDEERVVLEIDSYGKELSGVKEGVPGDVEGVVREILQWARKKGTANGREGMTSSQGSLGMIEC